MVNPAHVTPPRGSVSIGGVACACIESRIERGFHEVGVAEVTNMNESQSIENLRIKLFADGADKSAMLDLYANPLIQGFTTNPTLMHKAGINDYESFARDILACIPDRPISLEVFADDFPAMERQARMIAKWGGERLCKDSGDQYSWRIREGTSWTFVSLRRQAECYGVDDAGSSQGSGGGSCDRSAILYLGVRGAGCRHRARSSAYDG